MINQVLSNNTPIDTDENSSNLTFFLLRHNDRIGNFQTSYEQAVTIEHDLKLMYFNVKQLECNYKFTVFNNSKFFLQETSIFEFHKNSRVTGILGEIWKLLASQLNLRLAQKKSIK